MQKLRNVAIIVFCDNVKGYAIVWFEQRFTLAIESVQDLSMFVFGRQNQKQIDILVKHFKVFFSFVWITLCHGHGRQNCYIFQQQIQKQINVEPIGESEEQRKLFGNDMFDVDCFDG